MRPFNLHIHMEYRYIEEKVRWGRELFLQRGIPLLIIVTCKHSQKTRICVSRIHIPLFELKWPLTRWRHIPTFAIAAFDLWKEPTNYFTGLRTVISRSKTFLGCHWNIVVLSFIKDYCRRHGLKGFLSSRHHRVLCLGLWILDPGSWPQTSGLWPPSGTLRRVRRHCSDWENHSEALINHASCTGSDLTWRKIAAPGEKDGRVAQQCKLN